MAANQGLDWGPPPGGLGEEEPARNNGLGQQIVLLAAHGRSGQPPARVGKGQGPGCTRCSAEGHSGQLPGAGSVLRARLYGRALVPESPSPQPCTAPRQRRAPVQDPACRKG